MTEIYLSAKEPRIIVPNYDEGHITLDNCMVGMWGRKNEVYEIRIFPEYSSKYESQVGLTFVEFAKKIASWTLQGTKTELWDLTT